MAKVYFLKDINNLKEATGKILNGFYPADYELIVQ